MEEYVKSEQTAVRGKRIKVLSIMMLIIFTALIIKKIAGQNITSVDDFQKYISSFGVAGPLVLTLFQAFQVIVPILPGYLGCAAGAIAFGSATGFWCNYIGISLGSIAAYFIAKRYGMDVITAMFSEKQYRIRNGLRGSVRKSIMGHFCLWLRCFRFSRMTSCVIFRDSLR